MWELFGKGVFIYIFLKLGFSCLRGLYSTFLASLLGLNTRLNKLGQWAVVTGATDGIGKAYAFELARKGFDVVLISRTPLKLQNVASEISSKYNVQTKIIDVNFTETNIYDRIRKELSSLDIGVLLNNVGMNQLHPEFFNGISEEFILNLINCNIVSVTHMTKIVLKGMLERKKGLIINISSTTALMPAPLLAVYGASKAFVSSFSKSLQLETQSTGVSVQCLTSGCVATNMTGIKNSNIMAPSPTTYVRSAVKSIGVEATTAGYYMHNLMIYFSDVFQKFLPDWIFGNLVLSVTKVVRVIRMEEIEKATKAN